MSKTYKSEKARPLGSTARGLSRCLREWEGFRSGHWFPLYCRVQSPNSVKARKITDSVFLTFTVVFPGSLIFGGDW